MKTDWPINNLGRVCLPVGTVDPRRTPESPFRYIDISSICRDSKTIANATLLVGRDAPSRARQVVKAGDVLVSTVRPNLNAVALVPEDLDGEVASTGFCVLRPEPTLALPEYVFYWVRSSGFVDYLVQRATGASYPAVTDGVVKSSPLPLPPLPEQQRIVRILDEADALRRLRSEADRRMDDLVPAVFSDMFGDPVANPKGWPEEPAEALFEGIGYGVGTPPPFIEEGLLFLRAKNVKRGIVDLAGVAHFRPEDAATIARSRVAAGDVVIVRRGANTGDAAAIPEELDGVHVGYDLILRPQRERIEGEWFAYWFLSTSIQAIVLNIRERAAQQGLNAAQIGRLTVTVPPLETQREFSEHVAAVRRLVSGQRYGHDRLEALFLALLHRALKGDL